MAAEKHLGGTSSVLLPSQELMREIRPFNQFDLQIPGELHEAGVIAGDANHEVGVVFRMMKGINERF